MEDSSDPEVDSTDVVDHDEPIGSTEQAIFTGYVGRRHTMGSGVTLAAASTRSA